MNDGLSERRLVENEMVFRNLNQQVMKGIGDLKELAHTHNQASLVPDISQPLDFYCECSNTDCTVRIEVKPEDYKRIHEDSRNFVTAKGHQIPEIEKILERTPGYDVVQKNREPSHIISEQA